MIVPMKKIYLVTQASRREESICALRELGVVHIEAQSGISNDKLVHLRSHQSNLEQAIRIMQEHVPELVAAQTNATAQATAHDASVSGAAGNADNASASAASRDASALASEIVELAQDYEAAKSRRLSLEKDAFEMAPFGDFVTKDLEHLNESGMSVALCIHQAPLAIDQELIDEHDVVVVRIAEKRGNFYSVVCSRLPLPGLPVVNRPYAPAHFERRIAEETQLMQEAEAKLKAHSEDYQLLFRALEDAEDAIELQTVDASLLACEGKLVALKGFVPQPALRHLRKWANKQGVGLGIRDPREDEDVPTYVETNAFTKLLTPLYTLLGISPGYREMDVTFFFLVALTIFSGMLMGDAGYGAIFAGLAFFMKKKGVQADKPGKWSPLSLLILLLSGSMIFWGSITGTWFASRSIAQMLPFRYLVIPSMAAFPEYFGVAAQKPQDTLVFISCLLGVIHLDLACVLAILRDRGKKIMWAHGGWLLFLTGMFFVVISMLIATVQMPVFVPELLAAGFVLIVLFGKQEDDKSFVRGVLEGLKGLFSTVLDAIGSFSNIISYVRLFAVGVASVKIADAFNTMAAPALGGWAFPLGVVILILGHGLNVSMGLLSVLVHGARLNLLEFSGQLGIEWSGEMYKPFRLRGDKK